MAQIVAKSSNIKSIYDPTVGSGSLLLTVKSILIRTARQISATTGRKRILQHTI